jgi:D-glycero-alpha-D-manno-heptose-7-phosphate kinase
VGLLNALYALRGEIRSKQQLAAESIHIEQSVLEETVGSQDQVCAAYGGFNHISFLSNGEFSVRPVTLAPHRIEELNSHLMLFYTGLIRTASDVASSYVNDLDSKRRHLRIMKDLVEEGINVLNCGDDLHPFGELLHEAWQLKRGLGNRVSNSKIDELYDQARAAGAVGGKLTGAGGGGFLLLFVPPEKQTALKETLRHLIHVPFKFEFSGSQIIFFDSQQQDYLEQDQIRARQVIDAFQELSHT